MSRGEKSPLFRKQCWNRISWARTRDPYLQGTHQLPKNWKNSAIDLILEDILMDEEEHRRDLMNTLGR